VHPERDLLGVEHGPRVRPEHVPSVSGEVGLARSRVIDPAEIAADPRKGPSRFMGF
jgi:hypothetical protein